MKEGIHPKYYPEATVNCSCGNSWTVGSTQPTIRTDVCHACHPFFTGEQRIVDSEGQVDRFYQRLEKRQKIQTGIDSQREAIASGLVAVADLNLTPRTTKLLEEAGLTTVADITAKLERGDNELLDIQGFGQKSLIEVKKRLRSGGFFS